MTLAKLALQYRLQNNLTQYEAAELAGVSQSSWSMLESGISYRRKSGAVYRAVLGLIRPKTINKAVLRARLNSLKSTVEKCLEEIEAIKAEL